YQADPFEQTWVKDVMVKEPDAVDASWSVGQTIDYFMSTEHRHKSYPVVTEDGVVIAMVSRGDVLAWFGQNQAPDREAILE
ncbi:CBS domain-containing protein, partial [Escherichia coli]|uniref:CBS domain-containing protein n=2 Tax=Pseudomonadota TaxID=1224 RepID=UPI0013D52191